MKIKNNENRFLPKGRKPCLRHHQHRRQHTCRYKSISDYPGIIERKKNKNISRVSEIEREEPEKKSTSVIARQSGDSATANTPVHS